MDGTRLTFGFEGIWQGTAVLYDHQTNSLWMHVTGRCIHGKHKGVVLERLPTGRHTTWQDWRASHPRTDAMAPEKRWMDRPADQGYFPREGSRSGDPYLPPTFTPTIQTRDDRLALGDLVYGIEVGDVARAYPFRRLESAGFVAEVVAGVPVTVWFDRASRSAAAFDARVDGTTLTFARNEAGAIHDVQTKSLWTMEGLCVQGTHAGVQLKALRGLMAEWYGWYANHPKTTIWRQY